MIDHFVITLLMVSVVFLALGPNFLDETNRRQMPGIMAAVLMVGLLLYFAKDSVKGMSIGKWIMGIGVRDEAALHEVPSLGRLFLRNVFILIWPVELIVLVIDPEKKRLGDKVAKTKVFENENKPKALTRILTGIGLGAVFIAFAFLFTSSAVKNSDAYQVAIREIENNNEIQAETGGIKGYGMIPSGNINITDGYGQAQLEIKVLGSTKNLTVLAYLEKQPEGAWQLVQLDEK
ncbi:hypothetical protein GCM10027275_53570 [Rhabdobacter roseus]